MAEIHPLPGIRYNTTGDADVSGKIAPPYDVLEEADKQRLLAADRANFVKLDLPHTPPKAAGPPEAYSGARAQLDAWLADGTLVRERQPALYVYHQSFEYGGRRFTRRKFMCRMRLTEFGEGLVFPHEQTFGGPKEDRLALTRACQANMSPIFALYSDADNVVARRLEQAIDPRTPLAHGKLDGTDNRLWAVSDPAVHADIAGLLAERPVFIADGHHRYGTALMYRQWLRDQQGELPDNHPANFILFTLCAMEDDGLLILPTHRVLAGKAVPPSHFREDAEVEIAHLPNDGRDDLVARLAKFGPQAVALHCGVEKQDYMIKPRRPELLDGIAPDHSAAWRRLGVSFLHAYALDRVVQPRVLDGAAPEISYIKAADKAVALADGTGGAAFLLQPNTMQELRDVCQAGDLMPQKSTFFYPKIASGLVVNPLV